MNYLPNLIKNSRIINTNTSAFKKRSVASVALILRPSKNISDIISPFQCVCKSTSNIHKDNCIHSYIDLSKLSVSNHLSSQSQTPSSLINNSNGNKSLVDGDVGLEVLFCKRNRSGEVCFPGGGLERNELPKDAAERETMEEINVDISNGDNFALLGQLEDKYTFDKMKVHSFVYLQLCKETPDIQLAKDELVDCGWVDINHFILNSSSFQITPISQISQSKRLKSNPFLKFICDRVNVPFIKLPISSKEYTYKLWGLTLDMTSDLLKRMTGSSPIPQPRAINNNLIYNFYRIYRQFPQYILFFSLLVFSISFFTLQSNK
ncbi:hypothetical protein CYY_005101 [Polysphondylium violaceum]|uniref:Nudix hydrolase domain-containing protein n=1 Tax=Polysphondylium violaceum TaxID=133409 RepID=A0A8J4PX41_9MYCE|nr:hypothetical protein CYY_005101 [Polysphondylium violaceum]